MGTLTETESRRVAAKAYGRREGESVSNGHGVSVLQNEMVLEKVVV